jgi:hypothetical protein
MSDNGQMTKYVVSLNRRGREGGMQSELEHELKHTPRVTILEGFGHKTFTVLMDDVAKATLSRLRYATISQYEELDLL